MLGRVSRRLEQLRALADEALTKAAPVTLGRPHGLPAPLILSLTSYAVRFATLAPTLKRLLSQTIRPDKVILWVSPDDEAKLPSDVLKLKDQGLIVGLSANLGPFTKFYEARRQNPDAYIATADDDVIYARDMIEQLVMAHRASPHAVITHRSRLMTFTPEGPTPYLGWPLEKNGGTESDWLMPMGVGGALYPPGAISEEALDVETFQRLSPRNDDIWLIWMVRRAGFTNRMVDRPVEPRTWNRSQAAGLWSNVNGYGESKNDLFLRAMWEAYGPPVRLSQPKVRSNPGL